MERLSNRQHAGKTEAVTQYVYIEKAVETPAEPQIQYVDREVIKEVPVEKTVVEYKAAAVDLTQLNEYAEKQQEFNEEVKVVINRQSEGLQQLFNWCNGAKEELEMQRRALVGFKAQRDVDRTRRLQFIRRVKREKQKLQFQMKLVGGISLALSLISLLIRLS